MFKGSLVALITPFQDGAVDETAFQEHVAWQIGQGTHGLVPCGTTGESPALEHDEQERLIALCVEVAKGRAPVIAGAIYDDGGMPLSDRHECGVPAGGGLVDQ